MLDIVENSDEHLVLGYSKGGTVVILVRTIVNNSIHIKLLYRQLSRYIRKAVDEGVPLRINSQTLGCGSLLLTAKWRDTARKAI